MNEDRLEAAMDLTRVLLTVVLLGFPLITKGLTSPVQPF